MLFLLKNRDIIVSPAASWVSSVWSWEPQVQTTHFRSWHHPESRQYKYEPSVWGWPTERRIPQRWKAGRSNSIFPFEELSEGFQGRLCIQYIPSGPRRLRSGRQLCDLKCVRLQSFHARTPLMEKEIQIPSTENKVRLFQYLRMCSVNVYQRYYQRLNAITHWLTLLFTARVDSLLNVWISVEAKIKAFISTWITIDLIP